ncbi:MAG TPA: hypothetical protein VLI41_15020 [Phenylobacterium sp.]|uniref:hypothetical protein n=1 Tax=Phenylobacterium sp. TaxID=1871053 RepID=UPI002C1F09E0|nr:hypothetical protein [Phenylobacterium sp.]HSV04504.1 hypothetical protein [Phenylobacterium sp.]
MAEPATASPQEYIRRALEAAEIADGCFEPAIRESFFTLAELRLQQAEAGFAGEPEAPEAPAAD